MHRTKKCISTLLVLYSFLLSQNASWEKRYIREINGLVYVPISEFPYSGEVFELDEKGNVVERLNYKNGLPEGKGLYVKWFSNGQKKEERDFTIGDNIIETSDGLVEFKTIMCLDSFASIFCDNEDPDVPSIPDE